ncbi:MAG: tetratricopeptide repeat protein [Actinobacteria bacterium]|nr:tetratricopeptide repeat protein [Actinomycetota bacterium]
MNDLTKGDSAFDEGDWLQAEAAYRHALDRDPKSIPALLGLAGTLDKQKKYGEARRLCLKALELNDALFQAHLILGHIALVSKDYEIAEAEFRKALDLDPDNEQAYDGLGDLLIERERYGEAAELLINGKEQYPKSLKMNYNLGLAYMRSKEPDKSLVHFKQALEIVPDYADAAYNIGVILTELKRYSEARTYLERAVSLQPDNFSYQYALGLVHAKEGDVKSARRRFREFADKTGRKLTREQIDLFFRAAPPLRRAGYGVFIALLVLGFLTGPFGTPLISLGLGGFLAIISFRWLWYGSKAIGAVLITLGVLLISQVVFMILIFGLFILAPEIIIKGFVYLSGG